MWPFTTPRQVSPTNTKKRATPTRFVEESLSSPDFSERESLDDDEDEDGLSDDLDSAEALVRDDKRLLMSASIVRQELIKASPKRRRPPLQDYASATTIGNVLPESRLHAWLITHGIGQYYDAFQALGAKKISDLAHLTDEDMDELGLTPDERKNIANLHIS